MNNMNKAFLSITSFSILAIAFIAFQLIPIKAANPFLKNKSSFPLKGSVNSNNSKAVMIVMDASGSMSEPAKGASTKMLMSKTVLEEVLSKIDPSIPVGLRVYGSSNYIADQFQSCRDSILLVAPGTGNRGQMISKLRGIKPTGATPISYSLIEAIKDLDSIEAEHKSVVLISDGKETCDRNPCSLAQTFKARGIKMQFNVVGFDVNNDYEAKTQLECIANSTDGKFYTAETSAQLADGVLSGINNTPNTINLVKGRLGNVEDSENKEKKK
ncbi:MAG TPA: VWA domain-containing protein [Vampirovibrionales bacterium]